jgi:hypothetical protein
MKDWMWVLSPCKCVPLWLCPSSTCTNSGNRTRRLVSPPSHAILSHIHPPPILTADVPEIHNHTGVYITYVYEYWDTCMPTYFHMPDLRHVRYIHHNMNNLKHAHTHTHTHIIYIYTYIYIFPMARQPLRGPRPPHFSRPHDHTLDTPHSVGLLWTRDQLVAETCTWQHTTLTRDRHPCPRRDSNPQS